MRILSIETSCDETSIALVEASGGLRAPKFKILKHLVTSQIKFHEPFGGVVPNIAKREHIRNLPILLGKIVGISNFSSGGGSSHGGKFPRLRNGQAISNETPKGQILKLKSFFRKIDLIAVTVGPGLEPALWAGIEFAKKLAKVWKKPLMGANHMEGHLWSFLLNRDANPLTDANPRIYANAANKKRKKLLTTHYSLSTIFPAIALLVSGGHTILLHMKDLTHWKKLGETRDDAVGEAFDKVARILRLPYPGGPQIEKLAREGNENAINFPRPMMHDKNYDFSYSGLKTAVLYYVRDNPGILDSEKLQTTNYSLPTIADIAASFQNAATDVLVVKAMRAAKEFGAKSVIMAGGVAASQYLRNKLGSEVKKEKMIFLVPGFTFNTDNAAMIGASAYINYLRKKNRQLIARGDMGI